MNVVQSKWDEIIQKLKIEYDILDVSFKTWILPLRVSSVKDSTVYIIVPLKAYIDVITKKYLLSLKVCIAEITGAFVAGVILCNIQDSSYVDRRVNITSYLFFAPIFFE